MNRTLFAIAAAVSLSVAALAPAHATPSERDLDQLTTRADANNDGDITWSEVVEMRTQVFSRLDRNSNGFVEANDRPRVLGARFDEAFAQLQRQFDANSDRRVSRAEMLNSQSLSFEAGDVNGDRVLSSDEIAALRARSSTNSASS